VHAIEFALSLVLAAGLVGVGGWCCWTALKYEVSFRDAPRVMFAGWVLGHGILWAGMFAVAGLIIGLVAAGVARLLLR